MLHLPKNSCYSKTVHPHRSTELQQNKSQWIFCRIYFVSRLAIECQRAQSVWLRVYFFIVLIRIRANMGCHYIRLTCGTIVIMLDVCSVQSVIIIELALTEMIHDIGIIVCYVFPTLQFMSKLLSVFPFFMFLVLFVFVSILNLLYRIHIRQIRIFRV